LERELGAASRRWKGSIRELPGGKPMASMTIRNLDESLKRRLHVRAAELKESHVEDDGSCALSRNDR